MDARKDILWRVYTIYGLICLFAICIFGQIIKIKFVEGDKWKAASDSLSIRSTVIEPLRGNIYSADGKLLATSTPLYDLRIDTKAPGFKGKTYSEKIDSLVRGLALLFPGKSASEYKSIIKEERAKGNRYFLLKDSVSYKQYKAAQQLPLFNIGKYKGGLIVIAKSKRERLYQELAKRTIGSNRTSKPYGIEASFDSILKGERGERLEQRIAGGIWKPLNDEDDFEAKNGLDVVSTIDLNIQDVASNALRKQLKEHNSTRGCVILMEVATGEIKAIANLKKGKDGEYHEEYNYATSWLSEPGSTFKLPSLMAAMDDGYINLNQVVDIEGGETFFNNIRVADHDKGKYQSLSVQKIFEISSNVGVTKLIHQYYAKQPQRFIDKLQKFHLTTELDIQLIGERKPIIKGPKAKGWTPPTLPMMSYGYEVQFTPLQILNFYNAVANNGKMVKPFFVKHVMENGKVIKTYTPTVIDEKICSQSTINQARKMLEGVVLNGTAKNLKFDTYSIAGKTGTAKVKNAEDGRRLIDSVYYQASFCGYFPADKPLYSCIVVVYDLGKDFYYGNVVAGPVFKEIADKVYAASIEMHGAIPIDSNLAYKQPVVKSGSVTMANTVLANLGLKPLKNSSTGYGAILNRESQKSVSAFSTRMPDVAGMPLRDAVFLLESCGVTVTVSGKGKVISQSIPSGTPIRKGQKVYIQLS